MTWVFVSSSWDQLRSVIVFVLCSTMIIEVAFSKACCSSLYCKVHWYFQVQVPHYAVKNMIFCKCVIFRGFQPYLGPINSFISGVCICYLEGEKDKDQLFDSLLTMHVPGLLERPVRPPVMSVDEYEYKVFVSGKSGVGKSATVANLCGSDIPDTHSETPGRLSWHSRCVVTTLRVCRDDTPGV